MTLWRRILSERRIVVVPLLTALAINVLVIGLAVVPLSRSVTGDESRAMDVKLALGDAHRMARVASDTRTSEERAGLELATFYADVLPRGLADARSLLYVDIAEMAAETGLQMGTNVFEPEEVDDSTLMRYRTDVTLTGEYAGIRRFLYLLDTSEKFVVVENVKLAQSGQRQGASGSLEVVLQVATFYSAATAPREEQ
jgi:Tfp pilus assembly protein PilO